MGFGSFLKKLLRKTLAEPEAPEEGILWRGWDEETEKRVAERNRPILLFVPNPDPAWFPFLKAVFRAMPLNARLRALLNHYYYGLYVEYPLLPGHFKALGAGSRYNIAVLSPMGFTPMAVIDPAGGKPEEIVETIVKVLEKLKEIY